MIYSAINTYDGKLTCKNVADSFDCYEICRHQNSVLDISKLNSFKVDERGLRCKNRRPLC